MRYLASNLLEFGEHDEGTIAQMKRCMEVGDVKGGVLCADGHLGYSQPCGGVVAYRNMVSVSGVGYDIGCGNGAIETNLTFHEIKGKLDHIANEIERRISFGVGRTNQERFEHEVLDSTVWDEVSYLSGLKDLAADQLGTVGDGNHFVDVFVEEATDKVWIGCHFGSRGFGHKTASGFINLSLGKSFDSKVPPDNPNGTPILFNVDSDLGQQYLKAMELAGEYAYAGREYVLGRVLKILKANSVRGVHNHHNYAWLEEHNGESLYVVRKGATPCRPDQYSFIGGSMGDISVIVRGKDSEVSRECFYSTVHGAGRIMSRNQARGKWDKKTKSYRGGAISQHKLERAMEDYGTILRGGGPDESPFVYRKLADVLDCHKETLDVVNVLRPVIVVMAGSQTVDPYKD